MNEGDKEAAIKVKNKDKRKESLFNERRKGRSSGD